MVKGFKLRDYKYRTTLPFFDDYLYFCPFCQEAYEVGRLCEHFLFEIDGVPYFSNDPEEVEEIVREYEKYYEAILDLSESLRSDEISVVEYLKKAVELTEELKRVLLEKFAKGG